MLIWVYHVNNRFMTTVNVEPAPIEHPYDGLVHRRRTRRDDITLWLVLGSSILLFPFIGELIAIAFWLSSRRQMIHVLSFRRSLRSGVERVRWFIVHARVLRPLALQPDTEQRQTARGTGGGAGSQTCGRVTMGSNHATGLFRGRGNVTCREKIVTTAFDLWQTRQGYYHAGRGLPTSTSRRGIY